MSKADDIAKAVGGKVLIHQIDMTPTWRGILPVLLEAHAKGNTEATQEIYRLADIADHYAALSKATA